MLRYAVLAIFLFATADITWAQSFSNCSRIQYQRETVFTGGPYWVEEFFWCALLEPDPSEITLVSQMSLDRAKKFIKLASIWQGPMAITLVIQQDEDPDDLLRFISKADWTIINHVDFHIVWGNENGDYPINMARNVALERLRTDRVFVVDIDFFPHARIREALESDMLKKELELLDSNTALIFPAFEYTNKKMKKVYLPHTKEEMREMFYNKTLQIFHIGPCPGCHKISNYTKWFEQDEAYYVKYHKLYEPYSILPVKELPPYDERFANYGRNKIQFNFHISTMGFKFRILPFPFYIIHENHPPTRYRKDFLNPAVKDESKKLWVQFQHEKKAFFSKLEKDNVNLILSEEKVKESVNRQRISALENDIYEEQKRNVLLEQTITMLEQRLELETNKPKVVLSVGRSTKKSPGFANLLSSWLIQVITISSLYISFSVLMNRKYIGTTLSSKQKITIFGVIVLVYMLAYNGLPMSTNQSMTRGFDKEALSAMDLPKDGRNKVALTSNVLLYWKPYYLTKTYHLLTSEQYQGHFKALMRNAKTYLNEPLQSVVLKTDIAPSENKHDFFSRTFYKPGADGIQHPDVFAKKYDKVSLWKLENITMSLSLAYYLTGNEIYAKRCAQQIKSWFLDPASRMTPHLLYASVEVELKRPIGRQYGIVEAHPFKIMLEAVGLIEQSPYWNEEDTVALKAWFRDFSLWMLTSQFGHLEERSGNNHQSGFYALLMRFLVFIDEKQVAKRYLSFAKYKLFKQFDPDGKQKRELKRPDAFWYVGYNLNFATEIADLADSLGVSFWTFESVDKRTLRKAIDWCIPYILEEQKFEYGVHPLTKVDLMLTYLPMLRRAANFYLDKHYEQVFDKLVKKWKIPPEQLQFELYMPRIINP